MDLENVAALAKRSLHEGIAMDMAARRVKTRWIWQHGIQVMMIVVRGMRGSPGACLLSPIIIMQPGIFSFYIKKTFRLTVSLLSTSTSLGPFFLHSLSSFKLPCYHYNLRGMSHRL